MDRLVGWVVEGECTLFCIMQITRPVPSIWDTHFERMGQERFQKERSIGLDTKGNRYASESQSQMGIVCIRLR